MRFLRRFILTIPLSMLLAGCGDNATEKTSDVMQYPEMRKAVAAERSGDYESAIALYRETLAEHPRAAAANLQLALLLHEHRKDYIGAIYNYRQYVDNRDPREKSRLGVISNRIQIAEQLLAAKYVGTIAAGDPSTGAKLMQNISELNKRLEKLESVKKLMVESNAVLLAEMATLNARITRQALLIQRMQEIPDASGSTQVSSGTTGRLTTRSLKGDDGKTIAVQTYEVRSGDSLSKIAEYVYGDPKLWPRIRDANLDKISGGDRVRPGDVLIIP